MVVLGIESSCDETSVAVVKDGAEILSNVVFTQVRSHAPFQGIVPELASRLHLEVISQIYTQAVEKAGISEKQIDAVAVTNRPGLIGSLVVGLSFAKGLAASLGVPLIGVNHVLAHIYAPHMAFPEIAYPYVGLLVSGGHTMIVHVTDFDQISIMGTTVDDAVGEVFDKVAKANNWGYPGGPIVDKLAKEGSDKAYNFPSPVLRRAYHPLDFSYSGLKTAVIHQKEKFQTALGTPSPNDLAASFQRRAIAILTKNLEKAIEISGMKSVVAGGGVAANSYLRAYLKSLPEKGIKAYSAPLSLCTDNAAMIGGIGYRYLMRGDRSDASLRAYSQVDAYRPYKKPSVVA